MVYVTATLPILLLATFVVRGLTLPGAMDGVRFFFLPNWHKVMEPRVWINAASQVGVEVNMMNPIVNVVYGQVFNSVGIAFGSLIAFSSYNKFRGPVLRDTLIVTMVDAGISLMCGTAVFAVLGNLAHQQGQVGRHWSAQRRAHP